MYDLWQTKNFSLYYINVFIIISVISKTTFTFMYLNNLLIAKT
jgi:hypothetical protein